MKTITAQKNFIFQLILLSTLIIAVAFNATAARQDRQVRNFNKIEVSGAFHVTLTQGAAEKLTIEADEDIMPKIITEVKGGTLIIRLENNAHLRNSGELNIELTFINLDGIDLSGAVKLEGSNLMKFEKLEIEGSGASKTELNLSATMLECDLSGASEISLKGNAPVLEVELSGASNMDAETFMTRTCNLSCSGASKARVYVTETLKVEGSGATYVSYKGNPASVESDMSGASKLSKI